jgi:hypothetical protein
MNREYYTSEGQHPEDAIWKTKTFINELQKVQDSYFAKLSGDLKLTKDGESWLFDYIYNSDDEKEDFQDYLQEFNVKYEDLVIKDDQQN